MNVTPRNPEKYILATATAILSRLSLETHDKHDGAQVKESVLPYLTRTRLGARNEVEPASDDTAQGFTQRYTHTVKGWSTLFLFSYVQVLPFVKNG